MLVRAVFVALLPMGVLAASEPQALAPALAHLRSSTAREWSTFPETADAAQLERTFTAKQNATEHALLVRQQDVKQLWTVLLNGKKLGELIRDENDLVAAFAVPANTLIDGDNTLRIEPRSPSPATSDDIRVGEIALHARPLSDVLGKSVLAVDVVDADSRQPLPCRITIVNQDGSLPALGIGSNDELAVRHGTVYAARGRAEIKLPAGTYTVFAGRGFEYSLARTEATIAAGQTAHAALVIRREVDTAGYVACDTHVHTLTHSGHGDATIEERMLSLAGEGIELPIATDHNKHIDYEAIARRLGVRQHFTPVIGNEVTTPRGHFNIFPVAAGAPVPDHKPADWKTIFDNIDRVPGVKVAILNHARDIHSGVRPFGPKLHNAAVGENLDGWPMRMNAMEVVNSSAAQTDVMQLVFDWMTQLNRGRRITPVGSSDSHDVLRHFVGQGRTYIHCDDRDAGGIDVDAAVDSLLAGRVIVSYGLWVDLTVHGKYRPGDLARTPDDAIPITVRVQAPHWRRANRVLLFANGQLVHEFVGWAAATTDSSSAVEHTSVVGTAHPTKNFHWSLPKPRHDVHLVAVALGPGVDAPYWRTAKPYQPTSPEWTPHTLSVTGPVWLDVDEDGRPTSARDIAERLVHASRTDFAALLKLLADCDAAVAAQAAHLFRAQGGDLTSAANRQLLESAPEAVQAGVRAYLTAVRDNEIARGD
jgi:hypothetical protein